MDIRKLNLLPGAREARGIAVIIDVFRAFSTACYVMANGAQQIIPVGDIEIARQLKNTNPDYVLMGERGGQKPPDFDYGNSPAEIKAVAFGGKIVIHTTSAGTQGLVNATGADEVITGSFVNAEAIVDYIRRRSPETVSLVSMGTGAHEPNVEDTLCAHYLAARLKNRAVDTGQMLRRLRQSPAARNFFDPRIRWAPTEDFELCVAIARFDFVLKAGKTGQGQLSLKMLAGKNETAAGRA